MSSAVPLRASAVSRITAPVQCAPGLSRFRKAIVKPQRFSISPLHSRRSSSTRSLVCMAKPETINKVCEIVKTQLALSDDKPLTAESEFSDLGADSLDTVEIVMAFEEEFKISIEEDNAGNIATVQEAADLIDKLVESGSPPA